MPSYSLTIITSIAILYNCPKVASDSNSLEDETFKNLSTLVFNRSIDFEIKPTLAEEIVYEYYYDSSFQNAFSTIEYDYYWDHLLTPPVTYQQNFCSTRCNGGTVVDVNSKKSECATVKCFPCECHRPRCEVYGICCPDTSEPYIHLNVTTKEVSDAEIEQEKVFISELTSRKKRAIRDDNDEVHEMVDEKKTFSCLEHGNFQGRFLVIYSCPSDYNDIEVIHLCQDSIPIKEVTIDTFLRVIDNTSFAVYYNYYCALCNQVHQIVPWQLTIECTSYINVYGAENQDQLLSLSLQNDSMCWHIQTPGGFERKIKGCQSLEHWYETPIGTCNVTGKWVEYDPAVDEACLKLEHVIYRTEYEGVLYKNIFCLKCNQRALLRSNGCSSDSMLEDSMRQVPPFSLLLGFVDSHSDNDPFVSNANCSENEWATPDDTCLSVACSKGKDLRSGNCTAFIDQIRGLPYSLKIWLLPVTDNMDCQMNPQPIVNISKSIMQLLDPLVSSSDVQLTIVYANVSTTPGKGPETVFKPHPNPLMTSCPLVYVSASMGAEFNYSRDTFESELLNIFVQGQIKLDVFSEMTVKYQAYVMTTEYRERHNVCSSSGFQIFDHPIICESENFQKELDADLYDIKDSLNFWPIQLFSGITIDKFLPVSPHLVCPYVRVNVSETPVIVTESSLPWNKKIRIKFRKTYFEISGTSELNQVFLTEGDFIHVCRDLMDQKFSEHKQKYKKSSSLMSFIQNVGTIVLSSVSIVCLSFTSMTYFIFPSLRCEAGINNTFLSGSLALAQSLLLTVTYMSTSSKPVCVMMGILTHFSWMFMFSWSFICCFHMFKMFTSPTRPLHNPNPKYYVLKRLSVSLLMSVTVVAIVLCTSLMRSNWESTGYGRSACYLDNALATVVPLGVVTLCNFTFFLVVVAKIWKVKRLQQNYDSMHKKKSDELVVYMKLSTLTGVFWIFSILAEVWNNDPLRLVSIALNGCQGIFIFMSYTCNRRVLKIYFEKFGWKLPKGLTSSTTHRTDSSTAKLSTSSLKKTNQTLQESA